MSCVPSAGRRFREAVAAEQPLQVAGAVNAYAALLAERAGFRALYVSGAGVANASYGLPDLGITQLADVAEDVRRITDVAQAPVLVDIDTGFGGAFSVARTVRELTRAGAGALHIEDQVQTKRCGHRPGKELVTTAEMVDRVKAAVDARPDPELVIMARTDARASEGLEAALARAEAYVEAGADMVFAEAVYSLDEVRAFTERLPAPVLVNLTEFGKTPHFTVAELREAGAALALYPLSAFRAMSQAAEAVYTAIREEGTQRGVLDRMQTREALYEVLGYHAYERKLDELFGRD